MLTLQQAMLSPMMYGRTEQRFFGKPKMRFGAFLKIGGYIYESAALASRALVDKSSVLGQIITIPGSTQGADVLTYLRGKARTRREAFPEQQSNFGMLIQESGMNEMGLSMLDFDSRKMVIKAMHKNMLVEDLLPVGEFYCLEGLGFGLEFPEETRDIYRNTYEEFDEEGWESALKAGLNIPESPTGYPLEQRENDVLTLVAEYVHECRPELEDSLGLKHLLS